jgi:hypothetical protein
MSKGLYDKYIVKKRTGRADPDAEYRVLRIDADPAAEAAWRYYGRLVKTTSPELAADIEAETSSGAILKPDWEMPEPPEEPCRFCREPIDEPVAVHTGDGWFLCWDCRSGCGLDGYPIEWPFAENWATSKDFEAIGFDVV